MICYTYPWLVKSTTTKSLYKRTTIAYGSLKSLSHGDSQRVTKSMISCSNSRTVVVLPWITVRLRFSLVLSNLGVGDDAVDVDDCADWSFPAEYGNPPENIINGSPFLTVLHSALYIGLHISGFPTFAIMIIQHNEWKIELINAT